MLTTYTYVMWYSHVGKDASKPAGLRQLVYEGHLRTDIKVNLQMVFLFLELPRSNLLMYCTYYIRTYSTYLKL